MSSWERQIYGVDNRIGVPPFRCSHPTTDQRNGGTSGPLPQPESGAHIGLRLKLSPRELGQQGYQRPSKMSQWNGSSETGILRKNILTENHDELLVFGYACKLFRDDEKALFIDQGKHLIPWLGDEKIKIDRYDCRGALGDLSKYEASKEGYDTMRWLGLSEKEMNLEELCDKERYHSLEINEEEEEMYKEEEQKRKMTNAVQYNYDVSLNLNAKSDGIPTVPEEEEVEEEYIPSPILDVPVDIEIPKTIKEYARIEKTALFVCRQGPQMEILIKAKQSNNPQFGFLNQGDPLYKFYRHVLAAFKNRRYQGYEPESKNKTVDSTEDMVQDTSRHYLHPSLTSNIPELDASTVISVPQIPYKPSVNCAYSQLVNRIQGSKVENQDYSNSTTMTISDFEQMTYEQQQYYQYYYAQQYYEYYKQMAMYQQGQEANSGQFIPPQDFQNLDANIQTYIQQIAYNQYLQQMQQQSQSNTNSYAQIVTNVNKDNNPYAMNVPQLVQTLPLQEDISKSPVAYGPISKPEKDFQKDTERLDRSTDEAVLLLKKPILSLAAYGSSSESDDEETSEEEQKEQFKEKEIYKIPNGDIQIVIDKMAVYVSKNGEQFEEIVKAKADHRFDFLNETHEFYEYYQLKIRELKGEIPYDEKKAKNEIHKVKKEKKVIAPVSFSIKKTKEDPPKEIKSALPMEESDEDDAVIAPAPTVSTENVAHITSTSTASSLVSILQKYADNQKKVIKEMEKSVAVVHDDILDEKGLKEILLKKNEPQKTIVSDRDDPILEMMEIADIEDKQAKKAEDKIKDKLAAAAREKLASVSRERALQLERKRKAAAFLKLKSDQINSKANKTQKPTTASSSQECIEIIEIDLDDDDDDDPPKQINYEWDRSGSKQIDKKIEPTEKSLSRERNKSRDMEKRKKKKSSRSRDKSRTKEKKRGECSDGDEDTRRKKDDERRERKKKSHKRKHSKSRHESKNKKKSKKRHKRSASEESSESIDSS
ncbi:suppressor of white-apricot isoform X2 [Leptinotarsa decemlineata]|uniref:suppressor of white-apricot isoform X2 n=1 Tax=Leptinotarsa decemlineata TaxID=7539 RepID=UPI003D30A01B